MEEDSESPKMRQHNELEMLKSMFGDELEADPSSDWLDVSVSLQPSHDSQNGEVHTMIVLRVQCDAEYPNSLPKIMLSNSKGLSTIQINSLQTLLENETVKMKGEVMIWQLTHTVQEYLREHNKPGTKSFYEQMIERNSEMLRRKTMAEEEIKFMEWENIREKVNIKEARAGMSSDEENDFSEGEEAEVDGRRKVRFLSDGDGGVNRLGDSETTPCQLHRTCKYIQFGNKVIRGSCIQHDEHSIVYHGIDSSTGEPNIIREYFLKPQEKKNNKELLPDVLKQLESIETEVQYLKRLKHTNLVSYTDSRHIMERDYLVAYLVQEFVSPVTLTSFGEWDVEMDFVFLRYVVTGLVRALAFLHQHNVLHRNITGSSVFLSKSGVVKLGDYSVAKRMEDLQLYCLQIPTGGRSRTGRAADVLQLAALVLGLLGVPADPTNRPALPDNVPSHLKDFVDKCYLDDERRWTARQLLDHPFINTSLPSEPCGKPRRRSISACAQPVNGQEEDEEEDSEELMSQFRIPSDLRSQSRLSCEFRVLKYLGSGSFGKVLKARNRLDGGVYAIKAIELNPRNLQLNRKMIREVKLLSKLNHENVVRYFNSWIETTNVDDCSSVTQVTSTPLQSVTELKSARDKSAMSEGSDAAEEEEDAEDSGSDEEIVFEESSPALPQRGEPSESIVFADSGAGADNVDSAIEEDSMPVEPVKQLRSLYIQMEFCEKSTLRIAIDEGGLCEDSQRYWRLVRETLEGLEYIHQQDMIHRDLKPVNIFLDSCDHVKIGDFGLATSSLKNTLIMAYTTPPAGESEGSSHFHTEDSHTGGVGTSFYVAPELQKQGGKAHYNKKVDVYSLGIILFEMAHPPFATYMERCKTLSNLRLPEIIAPPYMSSKHPPTMEIVQQLLNHDPSKRPTCSELLEGSILPPPQVEDSELQDLLRHTLSNPQSKAYKYLISTCFQQSPRVEDALTYHSDVPSSGRSYALQETVRDAVISVMRRHGARCVTTPLLLPQTDRNAPHDASVRVMTHSGSVVVAPRDLRVPLARLVARTGLTRLRRYCVERTFRERRTHGYHPRETWECALDIITPTPGELLSDGEIVSTFQEIVNELTSLNSCNFLIRINHTLLLEAVLLSWGLEKLYQPVFQILLEATEGKHSNVRLTTNLESITVSSQHSVHLVDLFNKEEPINRISQEIIPLVKRKEEAFTKAKKALEQLKLIVSHAEAMGNKIDVKVCPGVVTTSYLCSGLMFDLCALGASKKRNKDGHEVLAAGCRYDGIIEEFRKVFVMTGSVPRDLKQSAVGMSVSLDKLVKVLKDGAETVPGVGVVVCSLKDDLSRDKAEIVKSLRAAGVASYVLESVECVDDVEAYSRENQVTHIVWLKESERGTARMRSWDPERERFMEKKMSVTEVVDAVVRATKVPAEFDLMSKPATDAVGTQTVNILIITEEKMQANNRRRYETQIKSKISSFVSNFSSRPTIEILGLFLDSKIIKSIASHLDFADDANDYAANTKALLEMYPRHKKYLSKVFDKVHSYCSGKENMVIILYSIHDDKFKQVI